MPFLNPLPRITLSARRLLKRVRYRNLAFKGGGVRGIAYMGALETLEARGVLANIERVVGTSAGAIAATLVSFRLPVDEMLTLFNSLDLSSVPQSAPESKTEGLKIPQLKSAESLRRLVECYGWYSSAYFHQWLGEVVAEQCGHNPKATFADFHLRGYRDLHIIASNLSRGQAEVFSFDTTPDVAVADAVRLSMSIPLFFEALRFDGREFGKGDFYVDGGLYDNYPLQLFDDPKYGKMNPFYRAGINWETLGLFLKADPPEDKPRETSVEPANLFEFLNLTVRSFYDAHDLANLEKNLTDQKRTAVISDCGISALKFDLEPGGPDYIKLYNSGRDALARFLDEI